MSAYRREGEISAGLERRQYNVEYMERVWPLSISLSPSPKYPFSPHHPFTLSYRCLMVSAGTMMES